MMSESEIRAMFQGMKTVAIVGLSADPTRDSHGVARFLQRNGYRVIPVNPTLSSAVLGEQPYTSLREVPEPVDVVTVFRRSEFVPEVVDDAIAIGAKAVWLQLGVVHHEAAQQARNAGLEVVIDRCIAVEHRRLMRMGDAAGA